MFEVDKLSRFSTKLSKNNMGHHRASDAPMMPPMLFFSKNKNYLSNQMLSFFPRTKITWGGIRGYQTLPTFIHHPQHPSPAHHTTPTHTHPTPPPKSHPHPPHHHTHPTSPHPPTEKKWGLNA